MSNNERQRLFQLRHPGYDRRRKARQRGILKRGAARARAARLAEAEAARAAQTLTIPIPSWRLALPAPVEVLVLPALNDFDALLVKLSKQVA